MRALVATLLVALTLLTGCGHDTPVRVLHKPPVAAEPPPAPPVGACYALTFEQAGQPTTDARPVPCNRPHTSVTFFVGRIDPIVDGHLVAVDSTRVVQQIAHACPRRFAEYVGGDEQSRRISRFETIWFSPTLAESDQGETWFRCDLVALAGRRQLMPLPQHPRGVLDRPGVLDTFGTCGTARPDQPTFVRVACRQSHRWRAIASVDLPGNAHYGGKAASDAADGACHDIAATHSDDPLKYSWSFEWPNQALWQSGQRWGLCWVPDAR